ncbi:MAG: MBL fold metallo-hydrolase [Lachnospiraceae bacterium]|nr:MBL fold metallo-hydrolase [Lachnospiraceae bacterium]
MIQRICCGNVNCYLVADGKKAILVDTGREKHRQKVLEACRAYDVRLLALTHGHVDHVQNAAYLARALGCPIAMNQADNALLDDNMTQPLSAHSFLGKIVRSASIKSFHQDKIPAITPDLSLEEGDSLDAYGVSARVIRLPGHTQGSVGIDVMERELIVGDALMNMFYPTTSMLYNDREAMLQSAARISALGERKIYFGHGKPVENRNWTR